MSDHHDGHDHIHPAPTTFLRKYVFSTDHKVIGIQFLFASLFFVVYGALLALAVRYQLAWPQQNVPYYALLPGKEDTPVAMTKPTPEGNVALWKLGAEVTLAQDVEIGGQTYAAGSKAKLVDFPNGLAVTVPANTLVRTDPADPVDTLDNPVDGFVPFNRVMGDYAYRNQDALTIAGTVVTIPGTDGQADRQLILAGSRIYRPNPNGLPMEDQASTIKLPVRRDATLLTLEIDGKRVEGVSAMAVNYTKHWLTDDAYLTLFTMHATIMVFFVLMPTLLGTFANFLIPLMIGARDMAFPKLNMLSFWIAVPSGIIMIASFWVPGGASGGGWTMYPPHSDTNFSGGMGATLWLISIALVGFSTIVGTLNYITTIINMRAPGMHMFRLPLTVWSLLITSVLALFATPVLTAAGILLLMDRVLDTVFFTPAVFDAAGKVVGLAGGQPLLWQHLFWFFGHPEVYILILPAMGVVSDVMAVHARKPVFGYKPMVFAMVAISGLGFIVWGHHMFQSGMNPMLGTTFMAGTIMIAVPSAIKTFNWLGTIWGGNIRFTPAMLFALGFVGMFVIGGLSGIFMASAPIDVQVHDTYFIVAHIHYVFFGGTIFGIFCAIYHWYPKMFGRQLDQRWGTIHFILTIIAFNGTFFLMHVLGIGGHPRRYASIMEYPTLVHLQPMNVIMTIFSMMLGIAQIPFIYNFFRCLPRRLGRNITALFVITLLGPTVIGFIYWGGFTGDGGWFSSLLQKVWGHTAEGGLASWQVGAGWLLYLALLAFLGYVFLTQLERGGQIATVVCGILLLAYSFMAMNRGGADDASTFWRVSHDVMVAVGLSVPFGLVAVGAVFLIWEVGGRIRMPLIIEKAMYVVILPLYMMPVFLKPDFFMWIGKPELFDWRWALVLLSGVPGLAYLVLARPRDAYAVDPGVNPWKANSLEWTIPSPPPHHNFDVIPTVYRGPYEYCSPVVEEDYLPQPEQLPPDVVEPAAH